MTFRDEICIGALACLGVGFIIYAYQTNDDKFWRFHDSGMMLIVLSWIALAKKSVCLSCVGVLFFALAVNSAITSFFFDIKIMGMNQVVFGWVLASLVLIVGLVYNVHKYIERKRIEAKNKACKKDARDKYSIILQRVGNLEQKVEKSIDKKMNDLLENLNKITTSNE